MKTEISFTVNKKNTKEANDVLINAAINHLLLRILKDKCFIANFNFSCTTTKETK